MKKRILSFVLILSIISSLIVALPVTANAAASGECGSDLTWEYADGTLTIDGRGDMFSYFFSEPPWSDYKLEIEEVEMNGGACIGSCAFSGCSKLAKITIIPALVSIEANAFYGCENLTSIKIPKTVQRIGSGVFFGCYRLTNITVAEQNNNYSSENGVLFNKEKTELICCPAGKSGEYVIPNTVTAIDYSDFYGCENLTSIEIPESVQSIEDDAFYKCSGLKDINVAEQNNNYSSENGVLFNKEKTELLCYPAGKGGEYVIPDSVNKIKSYAFYGCDDLVSVEINDYVLVENCAFSEDGNTIIKADRYSSAHSYAEINGIVYIIKGSLNDLKVYSTQGSSVTLVYTEPTDYESITVYRLLDGIWVETTAKITKGKAVVNDLTVGATNIINLVVQGGESSGTGNMVAAYIESDNKELLNKEELSNVSTNSLQYTILPKVSDKATYEIYDSNYNTVYDDTVPLTRGNNSFIIRVTAENGEYKDYPITIYAQSDKCELLNQSELSATVSNATETYTISPVVSEKLHMKSMTVQVICWLTIQRNYRSETINSLLK